MNKIFKIISDTPWKFFNEILMYIFKPFILFYLQLNGIKIGKGSKFYGFPKVYKHAGSSIKIGDNFECRSWWFSNPIGINHPTIICTWSKGAEIEIGNDVGISGGSIVASKQIKIGNGSIMGANSSIIDTDFHPTKSTHRRYGKNNVKSFPVKIGKNVFIGTSVIILKGSKIPDNAVVPAGKVIRYG